MQSSAMLVPNPTIGLDLGDQVSRVGIRPAQIDACFADRPRTRVVPEVGTHSPLDLEAARDAGP
jgi:hypothetical protein